MRRSIAIHIGAEATALAALRYDQQGARESATFEYDAGWLAAPDRFSIKPGLPLVGGSQFHRKTGDGSVFHSAIADIDPDGWGRRAIQRDHAKRRQNARQAGRLRRDRAAERDGPSPDGRRCDPRRRATTLGRGGARPAEGGGGEAHHADAHRTRSAARRDAGSRDEHRDGCGPRLSARARHIPWRPSSQVLRCR